MSYVCCVRPSRICHILRGGYRHVSWGSHMMRRSILFALPCPPICLAGLAYFPMPFYLTGVGAHAELLAGMPLYRGHEVADQPRHML